MEAIIVLIIVAIILGIGMPLAYKRGQNIAKEQIKKYGKTSSWFFLTPKD